MREAYILWGLLVLLILGSAYAGYERNPRDRRVFIPDTMSMFSLTSTAFPNNGSMPPAYTCDGANIIPPLVITDAPEGTLSYTLIMDDPDIPEAAKALVGSDTATHWLMFNIPPKTQVIEEGTEPAGTAGRSTLGKLFYAGPCPPDREHRYFFTLYALDTLLDLPEGATKAEVLAAQEGHVRMQAVLVGRYDRKR